MKNKAKVIFILFIAVSQFYFAKDFEGEDLVWKGINTFYSDYYDSAEIILTRARLQYPEHPAVHFVWAVSKWLKTQGYEGHKAAYTVLEESLDEISDDYKGLVEKYPDEANYQLFKSATDGLMARVHLGKKEWIGVVYDGFRGFKGVKSVHKKYPELWDSYLAMGVFDFYVSNSSSIVQFFAGLLGVDSDRKKALENIQLAVEKGEYSWIEASYILSFIYLWMDEQYEQSLPIIERLRVNFPEGMYVQHLATEVLLYLGRLDEAEKNLSLSKKIIERLPPASQKGWIPTLKYQNAYLLFLKGDLDTALNLVTQSIDEFDTELDTPLGFGYVLRGKIHDLKGERGKAISDYKSALKLDNYTSAMDDAEKYLREPYQ
tara:strand:+ start:7651 stop:8775 length:1125 start_codon:yes stop_codon:yes gene_type:complete